MQSDANGNITSVWVQEAMLLIIIDGIKARVQPIFQNLQLEEVSVMTGGVPANFGDATGGIIPLLQEVLLELTSEV